MKKLALVLLCLLALCSCAKPTPLPTPVKHTHFTDIPSDYSLEDAKADSVVVYENGDITSGQEVWDAFLAKTENGQQCSVRLGWYYTLPDHLSPELYEREKDKYPVLYIQDLRYNGMYYTLYSIEDGEEYSFNYKFMMQMEEDAPPLNPSIGCALRYVLVNDESVTWEQIFRGMVSSNFTDWIDHKRVYVKRYSS